MKKLNDFVPAKHPLRVIRVMVNEALAKMDELVAQMYDDDITGGRPSIAPEKLLRAMLQVLYSVRSEQPLMEQTQYNLLSIIVTILANKALVPSPGRDQAAVDAEMLFGQPVLLVRLLEHLIEEGHHRIVFDEALAILAEHCGHPDR